MNVVSTFIPTATRQADVPPLHWTSIVKLRRQKIQSLAVVSLKIKNLKKRKKGGKKKTKCTADNENGCDDESEISRRSFSELTTPSETEEKDGRRLTSLLSSLDNSLFHDLLAHD